MVTKEKFKEVLVQACYYSNLQYLYEDLLNMEHKLFDTPWFWFDDLMHEWFDEEAISMISDSVLNLRWEEVNDFIDGFWERIKDHRK